MTYARDERLALCALLTELGPAQPTLCSGWQTADLAAHLVLRERRPDAVAGVLGGPLAKRTRRIQAELASRTPFPKLIQLIKTGPPRLSFFGVPGADERLNAIEFFVHHEDVRRAQPGWQPRDLDPGISDMLWQRLGMAKFILRKAPVGVELVRADVGPGSHDRVRKTARAKTPVVTVTGTAAELTMWTMGRTEAAQARLDGAESDIAALLAVGWQV